VKIVNTRIFVVLLYLVLFAVSAFNMMMLPSRTIAENAVPWFTGVVLSLTGVLLALWVYQDGEAIRKLQVTLQQLESSQKK
jgi:hypothetical protein